MIDPSDVTKFDRSQAELEEFWLFSLCVAGKTAKTQAKLLDQLLSKAPSFDPFDAIKYWSDKGLLFTLLKTSGLGQHNRLTRAFEESLDLDLSSTNPADYEKVYGVGPKTSRFFIIHTKPNVKLAALDVHILNWLRQQGYDAPKTTPSGKKYKELEHSFLFEAEKRGKNIAELDLEIWNSFSRK